MSNLDQPVVFTPNILNTLWNWTIIMNTAIIQKYENFLQNKRVSLESGTVVARWTAGQQVASIAQVVPGLV